LIIFDANSCVIFPELQLSFQMWTDQMQDSLNCKQKGDAAFRHKDFKLAIECYTQVVFLFCFVFLIFRMLQNISVNILQLLLMQCF